MRLMTDLVRRKSLAVQRTLAAAQAMEAIERGVAAMAHAEEGEEDSVIRKVEDRSDGGIIANAEERVTVRATV